MRISLVIPSLNAQTLPSTLTAVLKQTRIPDEIIVVGKDAAGILENYPTITFVDTEIPVCAAAARNRGIEQAQGEIIAFLDSDCLPEPNWLFIHEQCQQEGKTIVGGSVALAGSNYWAQSDNVSMFHDFVPNLPASERHLLPTLNLSVHRRVIEKIGLMDESFPGAAGEDADWTIRMWLAGITLYFEPTAVVRHVPARTAWPDVVRHWRNLGYNAVRVRLRYQDELNTPKFFHNPFWLRFLSPIIAAKITLDIYFDSIFFQYWASLPVVYVTKILYCFGAATAVKNGDAYLKETV